jgi:hypothetical protein
VLEGVRVVLEIEREVCAEEEGVELESQLARVDFPLDVPFVRCPPTLRSRSE